MSSASRSGLLYVRPSADRDPLLVRAEDIPRRIVMLTLILVTVSLCRGVFIYGL